MNSYEIPYSQEVMAEVLDTPVTYEPMEGRFPVGLDQATIVKLHDLAREATPFAVTELQKYIRRYPTVPCLKNYLATTLTLQGKDKQAARAHEALLKAHSSYLFGRVAVAQLRVKKGRLDEALELLGPGLRLRDLLPERKEFHLSEVTSYYHAAGLCHLAAWDFDSCQGIIKALQQLTDDSLEIQMLQHAFADKRRQRLAMRMTEEARLAVHVKEAEIPDEDYPAGSPVYQHDEEMGWLYEFGYEMPAEHIRRILGLPRASLVADLQLMLKDSIRVGPACYWDNQAGDDEVVCPCARNALHFLAELKALEATDSVLDFFSQPSKLLDMWLGEATVPDLLYPHVEASLGRFGEWMKQPGVSWLAREGISQAAGELALREPARRDEVVAWFAGLLAFFASTPPEDNILDTRLVSSLVWEVCDLRAIALLPLVKMLYDLHRVSEFQIGTYDELAGDMLTPAAPLEMATAPSLENYYRDMHLEQNPPEILRDGFESWQESQAETREPEADPAAVADEAPAGRNDPCPCGSGRKYKKCCIE